MSMANHKKMTDHRHIYNCLCYRKSKAKKVLFLNHPKKMQTIDNLPSQENIDRRPLLPYNPLFH